MRRNHGRVALVGSGEYLPAMQEFEASLIAAGGSSKYVQIPTAAGRESRERLLFWQNLGKEQADRIRVEQVFLPIFTREEAMKVEMAKQIEGAGLIYLSGGDPHYLAKTLIGTPVYDEIISQWRSGTSLAGCSAGAMALGPDIPHFRKMKEEGDEGFAVVPHIRTIPHYNKFFGWIPDFAVQRFTHAPAHINVVGIDEVTAIASDNLVDWNVVGEGRVHVLHGEQEGVYDSGSVLTLHHQGTIS